MSEIFGHGSHGPGGRGDNRSEMPSDALGCTRNTLTRGQIAETVSRWTVGCKAHTKEEFLVSTREERVLNGSL